MTQSKNNIPNIKNGAVLLCLLLTILTLPSCSPLEKISCSIMVIAVLVGIILLVRRLLSRKKTESSNSNTTSTEPVDPHADPHKKAAGHTPHEEEKEEEEWKMPARILICVAVIVGIGFAVYWFKIRPNATKNEVVEKVAPAMPATTFPTDSTSTSGQAAPATQTVAASADGRITKTATLPLRVGKEYLIVILPGEDIHLSTTTSRDSIWNDRDGIWKVMKSTDWMPGDGMHRVRVKGMSGTSGQLICTMIMSKDRPFISQIDQ